eukprot:9606767-Ditylum_brightwellii.AAC.1
MEEQKDDKNTNDPSPKKDDDTGAASEKLGPPKSEFRNIAVLHKTATSEIVKRSSLGAEKKKMEVDSNTNNNTTMSKNDDEFEFGPSSLVGKPIRLYCPNDNSYHVGRIVDWRAA